MQGEERWVNAHRMTASTAVDDGKHGTKLIETFEDPKRCALQNRCLAQTIIDNVDADTPLASSNDLLNGDFPAASVGFLHRDGEGAKSAGQRETARKQRILIGREMAVARKGDAVLQEVRGDVHSRGRASCRSSGFRLLPHGGASLHGNDGSAPLHMGTGCLVRCLAASSASQGFCRRPAK